MRALPGWATWAEVVDRVDTGVGIGSPGESRWPPLPIHWMWSFALFLFDVLSDQHCPTIVGGLFSAQTLLYSIHGRLNIFGPFHVE